MHTAWRKGGLPTSSPAWTLDVLLWIPLQWVGICQRTNNAASVHLANHTGATREDFLTMKFSSSLLTFLKLPPSTGYRQSQAASQVAGSDVAPGQRCPLGLHLCPTSQDSNVWWWLLSPFLLQNLQVQQEVNLMSVRRKSRAWGRKVGRSVLSQQWAVPQLTKGRSREKKAAGSFLKMKVLRGFARVTYQFTALVNTGPFLRSRLKKVLSLPWSWWPPGKRWEMAAQHIAFLLKSSNPWHSDERG